AAVMGGVLLLLTGAKTARPDSQTAWLAARALSLLLVPAALYATGFLTPGEKSALSSRLPSPGRR
ncbi:MAG: hypothetical protein AAB578_10665, partial [Elusimicrobiota bacterium]